VNDDHPWCYDAAMVSRCATLSDRTASRAVPAARLPLESFNSAAPAVTGTAASVDLCVLGPSPGCSDGTASDSGSCPEKGRETARRHICRVNS